MDGRILYFKCSLQFAFKAHSLKSKIMSYVSKKSAGKTGPALKIIIIETRIVQPEPPAVAIVRQNGRSSAAGPRSLLHPCRGRSGGSRWSTVDHRHVSTPVKAAHHPSSWCRFVGSGLLVHRFEVWRCAQRDPVFACRRCTVRQSTPSMKKLHTALNGA